MQLQDLHGLQTLKDWVLSGSLDREVNRALLQLEQLLPDGDAERTNMDRQDMADLQVQADSSHFFQHYADSLLGFRKLTPHQQASLEAMEGQRRIHLSAPAGAGKTFVAVQRVLETLRKDPSVIVLYAAPYVALSHYFLRWLAIGFTANLVPGGCTTAMSAVGHLMSRLWLLHSPYVSFDLPYVDDEGRILCKSALTSVPTFELAVFDEAHSIFLQGVGSTILDSAVSRAHSVILLSDESQSSALQQRYPQMDTVKLTEVVRCTQRVVAGAAAFQMRSQFEAKISTFTAMEGPPLKTFIFQAACRDEIYQEYSLHVIEALWHVVQRLPGISFHRRVALLVPDGKFLEGLKKPLRERLTRDFPFRRFCLQSFQEALCHLPDHFNCARMRHSEQINEHIILDSVEHSRGLEQPIVICIGLDDCITDTIGDVETRSRLYTAISRAQYMAIVVNEYVKGGMLEFLGTFSYKSGSLSASEQHAENFQGAASGLQRRVTRHYAIPDLRTSMLSTTDTSHKDENEEDTEDEEDEQDEDAGQSDMADVDADLESQKQAEPEICGEEGWDSSTIANRQKRASTSGTVSSFGSGRTRSSRSSSIWENTNVDMLPNVDPLYDPMAARPSVVKAQGRLQTT